MTASRAAVGLGIVGAALYAAPLPAAVGTLVFVSVGAGTMAAVMAGPRMHGPSSRRPWRLLAVAALLFLLGAVVRPVAVELPGAAQALGDAFSVPGYAVLLAALATLLHERQALDVHALLDGLALTVATGLVVLTYLALPAARFPVEGRPPWVGVLAGSYPILDVVILLAALQLAFTTAVWRPALWLFVGSIIAMLAGDLGYAVIGRHGHQVGPPWLDTPFVLAYALLAATVLHPTMATLSGAGPRRVQAWSRPRLALLSGALLVPSALLMIDPPVDAAGRTVTAVASVAMVLVLLLRAVTAVSAYSRAEHGLRRQAQEDPLTGLGNRSRLVRSLEEMLGRAREGRGEVVVLFCDLDRFKLVNDSWGHQLGDALLAAVATRLRGGVGDAGTVCRPGGDEFVVTALCTPGEDGPDDLARRVLDTFSRPLPLGSADLTVSTSVGLACSDGSSSADELLADADIAMYRAKASGRCEVVRFDPAMREHVRDRVAVENALRAAVGAGTVHVHYQPVVDLATGAVRGFEALARLDDPVLGSISPATFIPIAEESGLVVPLGAEVLRQALAQLRAWQEAGHDVSDVRMSVNLSTRQILDPHLVTTVLEALRLHDVPSSRLCLEITESAMLETSDDVVATLRRLRECGVALAVDDFGTGYSALGYLRRFPVTEVKIDRSFVAGMGREHPDQDDEEIVRAVTAMAHALGLHVVAEGVENESQRARLVSLGVDRAQGWLFGGPRPAAEAAHAAWGAAGQPAVAGRVSA